MRGLLALVGVLSLLLLVGGAAVVGTLIARSGARTAGSPSSALVLDEPPGTRIVGVSALADGRLALVLQGGGPDRVEVVRATASVRLASPAQAPSP